MSINEKREKKVDAVARLKKLIFILFRHLKI